MGDPPKNYTGFSPPCVQFLKIAEHPSLNIKEGGEGVHTMHYTFPYASACTIHLLPDLEIIQFWCVNYMCLPFPHFLNLPSICTYMYHILPSKSISIIPIHIRSPCPNPFIPPSHPYHPLSQPILPFPRSSIHMIVGR